MRFENPTFERGFHRASIRCVLNPFETRPQIGNRHPNPLSSLHNAFVLSKRVVAPLSKTAVTATTEIVRDQFAEQHPWNDMLITSRSRAKTLGAIHGVAPMHKPSTTPNAILVCCRKDHRYMMQQTGTQHQLSLTVITEAGVIPGATPLGAPIIPVCEQSPPPT